MGQRHQLFAVAKIKGSYRTLAAAHHQWSFGPKVLLRCMLVMELFHKNTAVVSRELRRAAKLTWNQDVPQDKEKASKAACTCVFPFIANLVFLGVADRGQGDDPSFAWLEILNKTPVDHLNDGGYTILDITDPANPRYAFFFDNKLIGPKEYLKRYKHGDRFDRDFTNQMIEALESMPQVQLATVQELWPYTKWSRSTWGSESHDSDAAVDRVASKLKDMALV